MIYKKTSKKVNPEVNADNTYAQILLQVNKHSNEFQNAKGMIEESGIHILDIKVLSPTQVLLKLDVADMREIALKLTEHGFMMEGINPSPKL